MKLRVIAATALLVLAGGCAKQEIADLEQFVSEIKRREPGPIEPLPEIKQIETYVYERGDRRSPFKLGSRGMEENLARPTNGIAPDPLRRKEELEQYPVDSIRMVGTMEQEIEMWALVTIKDGTLFRIRAGNYMGQNHGQVTRVSEDRIELTEIVPDGSGGWQERQASIALKE